MPLTGVARGKCLLQVVSNAVEFELIEEEVSQFGIVHSLRVPAEAFEAEVEPHVEAQSDKLFGQPRSLLGAFLDQPLLHPFWRDTLTLSRGL